MAALPPISPPEAARYTRDVLKSLGKLARQQGQELLAHLRDLAKLEAKSLVQPEDKEPS